MSLSKCELRHPIATLNETNMTSLLRRFAAALVAAFAICLPASATSFGTDYTDLWFNPAESGWGVNLIQQHGTIFATLFVYGTDNQPHWFVADNLSGGQNNFSGTLYQTSGPAFSAAWTGGGPAVAVGSMSVTFSGVNSGTLTYVVSGQAVSKQIQRQTWRANNLAGVYLGGLTANGTSCGNPNDNGQALVTGRMFVQHGSGNPSMQVNFVTSGGQAASCTFNGTFTPMGRLASITGTFTCTLGSVGTFTMSEVSVTRNGFSAAFNGTDQFCTYNGHFGGVKDACQTSNC